MIVYAITTKDNPYDPFTQWEAWFAFDMQKKYNSCGLLARIANIDDSMTEEEKQEEFRRAITQILKYDALDQYRCVQKENELEY
jgi:hypothetical protein